MGRIVLLAKEEGDGDDRSRSVSPTYIIKRKATVCEDLNRSHPVVVGGLRSAWEVTWGGSLLCKGNNDWKRFWEDDSQGCSLSQPQNGLLTRA